VSTVCLFILFHSVISDKYSNVIFTRNLCFHFRFRPITHYAERTESIIISSFIIEVVIRNFHIHIVMVHCYLYYKHKFNSVIY